LYPIKKYLFVFLVFIFLPSVIKAQKFITDKGKVIFFSDAVIEDIEASCNIVGSMFNITNGEVVYILKIRDFDFQKSLMREHFNEKYMESEKFPKATFQGKINGYKPNVAGEQKVWAEGLLSMHGVSKQLEAPGTIKFEQGKIILSSKFKVKLKDFNIKVPTLVWQNISEEVEIKVDFIYKPL
jgi:hypothetical protein